MADTNQAIPEDYGGPKAPTLNPSTLSFAKGGSNTLSTVITNPSSDTPMTWSVDHPQGSWWQLNTYTGMLSPRASQPLHVTVNKQGLAPGNASSVTVNFSAAGGKTQFTITLHI
jgi:hypothetical protein